MRVAGVVVAAGLLGAAIGLVDVVRTARRLDRLHVRTDAAWAALDVALGRRVLAVSGLGASPACSAAAADAALQAGLAVREDVENELGWVLAVLDRTGLDPARAAQLADAEQRVVIARRVYNDAVRDTLALRSHRTVRWLRLAGTAPLPRYFEIAEPILPG
ncbi:MAG: NUDIX hydrolase [Pseudonocardiaceae bacterium]